MDRLNSCWNGLVLTPDFAVSVLTKSVEGGMSVISSSTASLSSEICSSKVSLWVKSGGVVCCVEDIFEVKVVTRIFAEVVGMRWAKNWCYNINIS